MDFNASTHIRVKKDEYVRDTPTLKVDLLISTLSTQLSDCTVKIARQRSAEWCDQQNHSTACDFIDVFIFGVFVAKIEEKIYIFRG